MKRLILTSLHGSSLRRTRIEDGTVYFYFPFVAGPLPSPKQLAFHLGPLTDEHGPGSHWSTFGRWSRGSKPLKHLALAEFCRSYDAIELWFDPTPGDQLHLIWLLDHLRAYPEVAARLRLRLVSFDLIWADEGTLEKDKTPDVGVTDLELQIASNSWQAYREETPQACYDLVTRDLSALPLLRPTLLDLIAELPSSTTGLGATEMRLLELISRGYSLTNGLFYLSGLRQRGVFSDWEIGTLLGGLAHVPRPAIAGLDDELRTIRRENLRDRERAYKRSELTVTEFGKAILAHKADFSRHNPIDRWWGGTHLTNDNLWRWNPALVKPQAAGSG